MKVNRHEGIDIIKAYISQAKPEQLKKTEKNNLNQEVDKVDISHKAQELQLYKAKLAQVPEVREGLVAILKKAIQEGTFQIDSKKIAEGIAEEIRLDKKV